MRMVCDMVSQGEEGSTWCVQGQAESPHQPRPEPDQYGCETTLIFILTLYIHYFVYVLSVCACVFHAPKCFIIS